MLQGPGLAMAVDAPVTQQKGKELLACPHVVQHGVGAGAGEVAHGFVGLIGHPDRREACRAVQNGKFLRVEAISSLCRLALKEFWTGRGFDKEGIPPRQY